MRHEAEPVDQATIDCWRVNYGLDKRTPAEAAKWWGDNLRGLAPSGCVAALGVALEELDALRTENAVLAEQVRALWQALAKVLDAGNREAAATMTWENARDNFSDSSHARKAHERAMLAASEAEREAHVLLATLKRLGA